MKFGKLKIEESEGAILAHTVHFAGGSEKKGQVINKTIISKLANGGVQTVHAAQPEKLDISENIVASRIAETLFGANCRLLQSSTGRANIAATHRGLALLNVEGLNKFNHIDECITVATCPASLAVSENEIIATVKIIPYAMPAEICDKALAFARSEAPLIQVAPFTKKRVGLILTKNNWKSSKLTNKGECILEQRLKALGSELACTVVTDHNERSVANAIKEFRDKSYSLILILGSCALSDRQDVVPAALAQAGGIVIHVGMPVEPGNLLMFGEADKIPVIGVPTCARSPKLNGFDWILQRILADLPVDSSFIMGLGVGGLLK